MKLLFLTTSKEDYLQDQLLIGLRNLYGDTVIDYPKKDVLYKSCTIPKKYLYGCGFSIWELLDDIEIDRQDIIQKISNSDFFIIVFGSIWRQKDIFKEFYLNKFLTLKKTKFYFLDGEDHSKIYKRSLFFGKYYKREYKSFFTFPLINKISFSIPQIKIRTDNPIKTHVFAKHVQCDEAYKIEEINKYCQKSYAFLNEEDYYKDIAQSEYAITMKKGGWDCLRHYEIAANWTLPCFYNLHEKPRNCAPHDLIDMKNVIVFSTAKELQDKIAYIEKNNLYTKIQKNVVTWINSKSCAKIAESIISRCR